jgi:hypothetical protein
MPSVVEIIFARPHAGVASNGAVATAWFFFSALHSSFSACFWFVYKCDRSDRWLNLHGKHPVLARNFGFEKTTRACGFAARFEF